NQYVTDVENQLNSAKNFLEQRELIDEGYKVILYCKNKFVHALGFTTPFFQASENITEIVVNSTFKTNQERFELFA
ncbi:16497_t:CDS:1, partial [Cetraspora pellucida]